MCPTSTFRSASSRNGRCDANGPSVVSETSVPNELSRTNACSFSTSDSRNASGTYTALESYPEEAQTMKVSIRVGMRVNPENPLDAALAECKEHGFDGIELM